MGQHGLFNFRLYVPAKHPSLIFVWTDARIEINGTVLSGAANKATLTAGYTDFDTTHMGDAYRGRGATLGDWTVTLGLFQDLALLDPAAFPILGSTVTAKLRPTSAAISASNPEFSGLGLVTEYPFLDAAAAGDVAASALTLKAAGPLVRSIS